MLMLDLCCGLGGASAAFRARGWRVVTVDIEPLVNPDILIDVREFTWHGEKPDFIWASPPCDEFARKDNRPWIDYPEPDLSIYLACKRVISAAQPRYWIIENVRGAIPYFGTPVYSRRPYFLWGYFPPLCQFRVGCGKKLTNGSKDRPAGMSYVKSRALERARVPYGLFLAAAIAAETQLLLF